MSELHKIRRNCSSNGKKYNKGLTPFKINLTPMKQYTFYSQYDQKFLAFSNSSSKVKIVFILTHMPSSLSTHQYPLTTVMDRVRDHGFIFFFF